MAQTLTKRFESVEISFCVLERQFGGQTERPPTLPSTQLLGLELGQGLSLEPCGPRPLHLLNHRGDLIELILTMPVTDLCLCQVSLGTGQLGRRIRCCEAPVGKLVSGRHRPFQPPHLLTWRRQGRPVS